MIRQEGDATKGGRTFLSDSFVAAIPAVADKNSESIREQVSALY
jgi:hypothetical protein